MKIRTSITASSACLCVTSLVLACAPDRDPKGGETTALTASATDTSEKFDIGGGATDSDTGGCPGGTGGEVDFSYIWISNSPEGTVSKIDTQTLQEVGRYRVGPGAQDPSRTSVNLLGDVAVADRNGGVTTIRAEIGDCLDTNGTPGIQTSTGPADVLPFGEDECVAWRVDGEIDVPMPGARAIAWTALAQANPGDGQCITKPGDLYVGAKHPTEVGAGRVHLFSSDGALLNTVDIPAADCNCESHGLYGGAVDQNDDLWTLSLHHPQPWSGPIIHYDHDTLAYEVHPFPAGTQGYGITVDRDGNPWVAGGGSTVMWYDVAADNWNVLDTSAVPATDYWLRGLMQDQDGTMWVAAANEANTEPGLVRADPVTGQVDFYGNTNSFAGLLERPAGISIDVDNYVWLVDTNSSRALRIDGATLAYDVVEGLVQPYTYSDMTGFGLKNAGNIPQG